VAYTFRVALRHKPLNSLVRPVRIERTTHSLEGCCSIQLSYGRGETWKVEVEDKVKG
jgi:hypothetical protein